MLQLYSGNPRAQPSSQMVPGQHSSKVRSMSSNKVSVAPRFGGGSGFSDDMNCMASPFGMIQHVGRIHNQLMKQVDSMFNMAFGGFSQPFMSPFESMMNFDKVEKPVARSGTAGREITRTYITQTGLGQDGKPYKEQYFSHTYAARGNDGTTLSEKQQAYQHSGTKLQKIALEKTLNDKGRRMEKERIKGTGEERTHNFFYGIDQSEGDEFERQWMKAAERIGFMRDFGKKLNYQNYQKQQIPDPSYQDSNARSRPQRQRNNEANADRWGLGFGGSQTPQSTSTPRHYTNDDIYIPVNGTPRVGRRRANDIMPTMPGRGVAIGGGAASRQTNVQRAEPAQNAELMQQAEPTGQHNEAPPRNIPVRAANNTRAQGVDSHGNFRNKNPQNVMPKAG